MQLFWIIMLSWALQVSTPTVTVLVHDRAAAPIAGATVTLTSRGVIVATGTTDAQGQVTFAPSQTGDDVWLTVRGTARDGSSIATEGTGIRVFVQPVETLIPLRVDTGGLIIPDPMHFGADTTLERTIIPVASPAVGMARGADVAPAQTALPSERIVDAPTAPNPLGRLLVLLFGVLCVAAVVIATLLRRRRMR